MNPHSSRSITLLLLTIIVVALSNSTAFSASKSAINETSQFRSDDINTSAGNLRITFVGHGTLMFQFKDLIVHVDPVFRYGDYNRMPKADIVLVTHEHGDHLDKKAIQAISTKKTKIIATKRCLSVIPQAIGMGNGDEKTIDGLTIEAIPAYNLVHERRPGVPFHPRDVGNGYVVTFADTRVYIAGDTENTPEMKRLQNIDIAFLPMNLPYTMTPAMVADAARAFRPAILYPYHYGETDTNQLLKLLAEETDITVRIRPLK